MYGCDGIHKILEYSLEYHEQGLDETETQQCSCNGLSRLFSSSKPYWLETLSMYQEKCLLG